MPPRHILRRDGATSTDTVVTYPKRTTGVLIPCISNGMQNIEDNTCTSCSDKRAGIHYKYCRTVGQTCRVAEFSTQATYIWVQTTRDSWLNPALVRQLPSSLKLTTSSQKCCSLQYRSSFKRVIYVPTSRVIARRMCGVTNWNPSFLAES